MFNLHTHELLAPPRHGDRDEQNLIFLVQISLLFLYLLTLDSSVGAARFVFDLISSLVAPCVEQPRAVRQRCADGSFEFIGSEPEECPGPCPMVPAQTLGQRGTQSGALISIIARRPAEQAE